MISLHCFRSLGQFNGPSPDRLPSISIMLRHNLIGIIQHKGRLSAQLVQIEFTNYRTWPFPSAAQTFSSRFYIIILHYYIIKKYIFLTSIENHGIDEIFSLEIQSRKSFFPFFFFILSLLNDRVIH